MSTATVIGPSFLALQVRDLEAAAAFYESKLGLRRAAQSPPHAVVFDTTPVFAVRDPLPGTDLDSGQPGLGVALWLAAEGTRELHDRLAGDSVPILTAPFDGPFGLTFAFRDPDGYAVTVHEATTAP